MPSRKYFYEENGQIKKYCYCTLCGKGPFTQSQVVKDRQPEMIREVAGQNSKIYYCYCCDRLASSVKESPKELQKESEPKIIQKNKKVIEENIEEDVSIVKSEKQSDEEWYVILVKNTKGQYFCRHTTDTDQTLNDINTNAIKIPNCPCQLVYKKLVYGESEAIKLSESIKKRPKQYKEQLIAKYQED